MPKLKVYRTPIGFHDAYVAAPSQKAALAAWGSDKNLFARGAAELVDDLALTAAALAEPGKVVRRLRGTTAEQIAALPADATPSSGRKVSEEAPPKKPRAKPKPRPKPAPRPSRDELDQAEWAIAEAEREHDARRRELADREAALARERKALDVAIEKEGARLQKARNRAAEAYEAAMRRWRG